MPLGLITTKVGMSRVFLPSGEAVPVTYLQVEPNTVVRTKSQAKDGYDAIVLGPGGKMWRSRKGQEHVSYRTQREWRVDSLDGYEAGKQLKADVIPVEAQVSVEGVSKGKGFQGVMKRWGFHGGPGSHGSHFKREPGSIGMRTDPGRIFKGKKMAGRMGGDQITIKRRPVLVSDASKGVIAVKGAIPGPNGGTVFLTLEA
jgi:large subunit ribosomal protein L3